MNINGPFMNLVPFTKLLYQDKLNGWIKFTFVLRTLHKMTDKQCVRVTLLLLLWYSIIS